MPREWPERHIRELVDEEYKILGGQGGTVIPSIVDGFIELTAFWSTITNYTRLYLRYVGTGPNNLPNYRLELRTESWGNHPDVVPVIIAGWGDGMPQTLTLHPEGDTSISYAMTRDVLLGNQVISTIGDTQYACIVGSRFGYYDIPGGIWEHGYRIWVSDDFPIIGDIFNIDFGRIP